jgi:hypothetical protein
LNTVRLSSAQEFARRAGPFLTQAEGPNCLVLGLSSVLISKPDTYGEAAPVLVVVEDRGQVRAAALQTPPRRLALARAADLAALETLAGYLQRSGASLPGVLGPAPESGQFAKIWRRLTGQSYRKRVSERIYQLERVIPARAVPGRLRRVTESDRPLLLEWVTAFNTETFGDSDAAQTEWAVTSMLTLPPQVRGAFVWEDGVPVSLTGYTGPTPNGMRVGPVYTPPARRGRGYASACVAAVSQCLLDEGRKYVFLFTDLANPTSNHIYQAIGYQPVCDADEYAFEAAPA